MSKVRFHAWTIRLSQCLTHGPWQSPIGLIPKITNHPQHMDVHQGTLYYLVDEQFL